MHLPEIRNKFTSEEQHAFLVGLCEGFCPLPYQVKWMYEFMPFEHKEYHYYTFGRAIGFACLLGFLAFLVTHAK